MLRVESSLWAEKMTVLLQSNRGLGRLDHNFLIGDFYGRKFEKNPQNIWRWAGNMIRNACRLKFLYKFKTELLIGETINSITPSSLATF